jgi:ornithine carbamoyltransferase
MNLEPRGSLRASGSRHCIDLIDWDGDQIRRLLKDAAKLKKAHARGKAKPVLQGRVLGLLFEKPSLRTRVSFQAGMAQLGGEAVFLSQSEAGLGKRESLPDVARTLSQYVDAIVLRTFKHETVEEFARWAGCPVINGLSDYYHPCQALGDLLTMRESFGDDLAGRTLAFIGDGNNVARSLALACGKVGVRFVLSAPGGYTFDRPFLDVYHATVGGMLAEEPDPVRAVAGADVIYTDVWASMGQEAEAAERGRAFEAYQVNEELLRHAPPHAKVMHCLPAHRGEEITDGVLDGPQSVVFPQAGNRMHAQKALLVWALGG